MRLDYVVLAVTDLDRSLSFYRDVVGFELAHRSGPYAQFATGGTRFGLYQREAFAATVGVTADEVVAAPASEIGCKVEDCERAFGDLVARGATAVTPPTDRPWGQRTAYVADPDGHLLELAEDTGPPAGTSG